MEIIDVKEFIITCEACGNVKKFMVKNEQDSERIFKQFSCENTLRGHEQGTRSHLQDNL